VTRSHVRIPAYFSHLFGIPSKFTFHLHPTAQKVAKHVLHERPLFTSRQEPLRMLSVEEA
jgi:hypothetical protein